MSQGGERRFRAGLVQLRSGRSVAPNLDKAEELIRRAAKGGAIYVQTPENTGLMEVKPELVVEAAESEGKNAPLARLKALARELGIWLHVGSLAVKLDKIRIANRSYLIDPEGRDRRALRQAAYVRRRSCRRRELSRVANFKPGEKAVLADLPSGGWA